ncbi:hypothetical protein [Flagellimonas sp. GZD32]|uniref:hypothetical protein n=1 Tax=Flagellimonas cixiensis TaxID=3228750 RepID=UPI0035C92A2C
MRQIILALMFVMTTAMVKAQTNQNVEFQKVEVGDVFEIGRPETPTYKHIDFPRANFIIKKGGIANYKTVEGNKVVVTAIKEAKDGTLQVKIKRTDGRKFFNTHAVVSADIQSALQSGELNTL